MTKDQLFLELYKEQTTHARHTEQQRQQMTQLILATGAALLGAMAALRFSIYCLPLAAAMIRLGSFGSGFTRTYSDRLDGHTSRARELRKAADSEVAAGAAQRIFDENPVVKSDRIRTYWYGLNRAIQFLGIVCLALNLVAVVIRVENWRSPWPALREQLLLRDSK
jgi:hypothetical protein